MRFTFTRFFLAIAVGLSVMSCSSVDQTKEAFSTVFMFGRQLHEQQSFFGRSTAIFYPNGVPEKMAELPSLSPKQWAEIQNDLDLEGKQLLRTLDTNHEVIQTAMQHDVTQVVDQKFMLETQGAPIAKLNKGGEIHIDVKVIQAIFRGILMSSLDISPTLDAASNEEQRNALAKLISARQEFLSASPSPTVSFASNVVHSAQDGTGGFEMVLNAIGARFDQVDAMRRSEEASMRYDDALAFIIAHELGHRALNHYARLNAGEKQAALELEADRFGALLVALTRNASVRPNNGYPFQLPNMAPADDGWWCFTDINYTPQGHRSFFDFGYSFAGFDSLSGVNSDDYPTVESRVAACNKVTNQTVDAIQLAQDSTGNCFMPANERARIAADPMAALLERRSSYREDLDATNKQLKLPWFANDKWYLNKQQLYNDLLSDTHIPDVIYLDFFKRFSAAEKKTWP